MLNTFFKYTIILLIILTANILSQNYNDALRLGFPGLGSNARALGMGNAFNALSDDASASYFNPAGFGLLKKMEFSGGLNILSLDNEATLFGSETKANTTNTTLNRISFAFPFPTYQGSLVFGLSYHKSKDLAGILEFDGFNRAGHSKIQSLLDTDIPYNLFLTDEAYNTIISGNLNQSGDILHSGNIDNWTFSGAVEIQKNLFIGGNLTVASGNFESISDFYEDDTNNFYEGETAAGEPSTTDFKTFYFNNRINWEISGWNAKVGFLYQIQDFARIGATVQFPKSFTVEEEYSELAESEFGTGSTYEYIYNDNVKYSIQTPFELTGAVAFNLRGLILSAEATLVDYAQMKFEDVEGFDKPQEFIDIQNSIIKEELRTTVNLNAGFEYTVPKIGLRLRGGYINQPSAFKGDGSDFSRKYLTAGIGYLADGTIGIDLGYAYGWWKDLGDNYGVNLSRTYQDISVHNIIITTTYRF